MSENTVWRCSVCGYSHTGATPPASCPVCRVSAEKFNASEKNESVFSSNCAVCGKKMGFFNGKVILKNGYVCNRCWDTEGLGKRIDYMTESRNYTAQQIRDMVHVVNNVPSYATNFNGNTLIADLVQLDDSTQTVQIITKAGFNSAKEYIKYNQIVNFELVEDGDTITKGGLGSATVGGALFGAGGAIAGAVLGAKKTKAVCNSLQLRISVADYYKKVIVVNYIELPTKSTSMTYKQMHEQAQKAVGELQVAVASIQRTTPQQGASSSMADEIAKLNQLREQGVLTEEEFITAKRKLLGI